MMQIGPIQLSDFEIPSSVTFGGRHRLSIHKSADGTRTIDTLGPDDNDIQFHGIFSGDQAEDRARALNSLRLDGSPVWLVWNTFRYRVIVRTINLDYRNSSWILYRAACIILDQPGAGLTSLLSVQTQVASDMLSAISASSLAGIDISGLTTMVSTAFNYPVGSTTRTAALGVVATSLGQLGSTMQTQVSDQSVTSSFGSDYSDNFESIVSSAGLSCNAAMAFSYLSRVQTAMRN